MGAEILIAVDLNSDVLGRHLREAPRPEAQTGQPGNWMHKLRDNLAGLGPARSPDEPHRGRST